MSICNGDNERKLKINGFFLKSKGHNSAENYSTGPKIKLNLRIPLTHKIIYSEFQFKAKEKYRGVFEIQRSGDKTSSGEIGLDIRTYASPKMSICNGDNERKLKINGIFPSARGMTLPKIIQPNPNLNSTCVFS